METPPLHFILRSSCFFLCVEGGGRGGQIPMKVANKLIIFRQSTQGVYALYDMSINFIYFRDILIHIGAKKQQV